MAAAVPGSRPASNVHAKLGRRVPEHRGCAWHPGERGRSGAGKGGDQARANSYDAGRAFFGRIAEEAAAKRDLPDAIAIAGSLQQELHAALGAVRADIRTPDLIVLLKAACMPKRGQLLSTSAEFSAAADSSTEQRIAYSGHKSGGA